MLEIFLEAIVFHHSRSQLLSLVSQLYVFKNCDRVYLKKGFLFYPTEALEPFCFQYLFLFTALK